MDSFLPNDELSTKAGQLQVGTMRQLGMVLSMAVVMLLLSRHVGNAAIVAVNAGELLHAMRVSLRVFSVLCLGGIFASLARGPSHREAGR